MKEGQIRIPAGCAIAAIFDKTGKRMSGVSIMRISFGHAPPQ